MKQKYPGINWFLIPLLIGAALLVYQCFTMAHAATNAVDRVQRLYDPANPGDSATVRNDTLNAMALSAIKAVRVKATAGVIADTIQGSAASVAIVDDTLWINRDSTNCVAVVWFAGTGAGIKYNCSTDSLYWTRDGSTWVQFGTGSGGAGTGDIDAVTAGNGLTGGGTSGSVTLNVLPGWGIKIDNDSVEVNATQVMDSISSSASDSNAQVYSADRYQSYHGYGSLILGNDGDSTFIVFDSLGNYAIVWANWYVGVVDPDSVTMLTKHQIESAIHDTLDANGFITGINGTNGISGGASQGVATLQIDWQWLYGFNDTTSASIPRATLADSTTGGAARAQTSKIADSSKTIRADAVTEQSLKAVNTAVDEDILTYESTTGDFEWHTPSELGLLTSETGDISNVGVTAPITGGGSSGSVTVGFDWTWLYGFVDTTTASIPVATLANSVLYSWLYTTIDTSSATVLSVALGTGGTGGGSNGALTLNVIAGTSTGLATTADSVFITTVPDANIATTLCRDTEASGLIHDSLFANTPGYATKANVHDSLFANTPGYATKANVHDSLFANTPGFLKAVNFKDSLGTGRVTSTIILDGTIASGDIATGAIDSIRLGTACVKAAEIDSTVSYVIGNLRTRAANQGLIQSNNFRSTDSDSSLKIGGGGGLTIGSSVALGTDITDDTLVVDYYPEFSGMVLADGIMSTYKDSMKIYGDIDNVGNIGNVLVFSDSLLNAGQHRRAISLSINHPNRTDSLRYIIIQGLAKDSSGTNEMYLKAMLRTTLFNSTNVDSNAAGNIKDYDSLGGDFSDNAVIRTMVLTGGAVTQGTPWHLLIIGRHDSGTAFNWVKVGRVRCVYSRTAL